MNAMKELYEKVKRDDVMQKKFAEIIEKADQPGKEKTEERLAAFAKDAGYDISVEDMVSFFTEMNKKSGETELSETELDLVAGGKMKGSGYFTAAVISVASFGVACVVISAGADMDKNAATTCGSIFENM